MRIDNPLHATLICTLEEQIDIIERVPALHILAVSAWSHIVTGGVWIQNQQVRHYRQTACLQAVAVVQKGQQKRKRKRAEEEERVTFRSQRQSPFQKTSGVCA